MSSQSFQQESTWVAPILTSKWNSSSMKNKGDSRYITKPQSTWEKLLPQVCTILLLKTWGCHVISSRNLASKLCRSFCCFWSASYSGGSTSRIFTKSRQPPSRPNKLLVVTDPRANHQPFTVYLNVPTYFHSGKADCPPPEQGQGAPSAGLMCRGLAGKLCTCMAPTLMSTCTRSHLKRP